MNEIKSKTYHKNLIVGDSRQFFNDVHRLLIRRMYLYVINHLLDNITFIHHDHSELFDIKLDEMAVLGN